MHVKIIKDCITIHPPRTIGFESEVPAALFLIPYSFPVYTVHTHWKRMRIDKNNRTFKITPPPLSGSATPREGGGVNFFFGPATKKKIRFLWLPKVNFTSLSYC